MNTLILILYPLLFCWLNHAPYPLITNRVEATSRNRDINRQRGIGPNHNCIPCDDRHQWAIAVSTGCDILIDGHRANGLGFGDPSKLQVGTIKKDVPTDSEVDSCIFGGGGGCGGCVGDDICSIADHLGFELRHPR